MEGQFPSSPRPASRLASLAAFRQGATETHGLDYLLVAYRHRYIALSVFLVVVVLALVNTLSATPMYRATARIMIELEDDEGSPTAGLSGVLPGENYRDPAPYYQTQFR